MRKLNREKKLTMIALEIMLGEKVQKEQLAQEKGLVARRRTVMMWISGVNKPRR